jgi:lipoprotein-anchoring transpeptidase ErfK/SrfK
MQRDKFRRRIRIVRILPAIAAIATVAIVVACVQAPPPLTDAPTATAPAVYAPAPLTDAPTAIAAAVHAPAPPTVASTVIAPAVHALGPLEVDGETGRLRAALHHEVPNLTVDAPEASREWIARAQSAIATSDFKIDHPQLVVVADSNPRIQQMRILLAQSNKPWMDLGGTKVSTGQTGRRDYYVTPTGVFLHTDAILDWRAEGTFNENHIRGLGVKSMRVWDFGWQNATKGWGTGETGDIRLLLHATDPAYLERRIGHPASKGCVRIPAVMNRFLDRHGVLDAEYEHAAKEDLRFAALLLPDRTPTPLAGDALIIVDSAGSPPTAAQTAAASAHSGD